VADAKPNATLVGLRGPRKGKKYTLGDAEFRIGREASCEIVLHDDFVAPVHTVIEPRGGLWAAVNRGMNGTLVNGARIEGARTLAPGDQVQIGAEAVFEFRVTEPKGKQKGKKKKTAGDGGTKRQLWENPFVLGGIGAYLLLLIAFFAWVSGGGSGTGIGDLDPKLVEAVIGKTRDFLVSDPGLVAFNIDAVEVDSATEYSAGFHALVAARRNGADDVEDRADRIVEVVERELFQAWNLERQQRWDEAIERYRRITWIIPPYRASATRLAADRIQVVRKRKQEHD
jgi:pSer/pThr/pTyr-binding forkhead associated (FHA) protein